MKNSEFYEAQILELWQQILGRNDFGVHDNFLALGGYSILGIRLIARLREKFSNHLNLSFFIEFPTVAEQARAIASDSGLQDVPHLHRRNLSKTPLSYSQHGGWILEQLFPDLPMGVQGWGVEITGPLDEGIFEEALNELIDRHEILRASVEMEGTEPYLCLHPERRVVLKKIDLRNHSCRREEAIQIVQEETRKQFDLKNEPLVRGSILRLEDQRVIVVLALHHLICDGLSMEIFFRELSLCYRSFQHGLPAPFFPLKIQFSDFAMWQRERLTESVMKKELTFWKSHLAGVSDALQFPTFLHNGTTHTGKGALETRLLGKELTTKLTRLAESQNNTLFQTLVTGFTVLLFRYTGQDRFLIGIPVAERDRAELESLIGRIADIRILSMWISSRQTFDSAVKQVQEELKRAFSFQNVPPDMLLRELRPDHPSHKNPLIQVVLNWRTLESRMESMDLGGMQLEPLLIHGGSSRYPMAITFVEDTSGIRIELEYSTDLFDQKTIQMYLRHFENILRSAVSDSSQPVSALDLMDPAELECVTKTWNDTHTKICEEPFIQSFEQCAVKHADEDAVIYGKETLTYAELNHRANILARKLLDAGIQAGARVALCLEHTPDRVLSILASWKAGAAWIPLDPEFPGKRLMFQLQHSEPHILITTTELKNRLFLDSSGLPVLLLDLVSNSEPCENLNAEPGDLAYLIYTSGTTGFPKAVCVEHQSVTNLFGFVRKQFPLHPGDRTLQFCRYTFDLFLWELLMTLSAGAALVIDRESLDLTEVFARNQISHTMLSPSILGRLSQDSLPVLQVVFSGGETCPFTIANRWRKGRRFLNAYGPTEATVVTVIWEMTEDSITGSTPIGRPISNARAYILDQNLQPVPPGITGELYLAGRALSRGYWRNEALTSEKFFKHKLPVVGEELLYRTGDLARWRPDGNIEHAGRIDDQVKIRGIRIEPSETEAILRQHPVVRDCVVVPIEITPGERALVAYCIFNEKDFDLTKLQKFLSNQLPMHLVPGYVVPLDQLPLNNNGKLDKKLLPAPVIRETASKYLEPRNETESIIANIWCDVLKKDRVGVNDNFFNLGGHSLLGTQVMLRLRNLFGIHLPIRAIFDFPTVAGLAECLSKDPSFDHSQFS